MKNNKMLLVALTGLFFGLSSQVKALEVGIEFDFANKSGEVVYLSVENAQGESLSDEIAIKNGRHHHFYAEGAPNSLKSLKIKLADENKLDKKVFQVSAEGKSTCYLTYGKQNGKLTLYPQTIKHGKSVGKTGRGMVDRATNVMDADIRQAQEL